MEEALDALPKELCHVDFSLLRRTETLAEDLRAFTGTRSGDKLPLGEPSHAVRQYVARLEELAAPGGNQLLLLAHAYTRYLGDLSGGQILAKAAQKAYGLQGGSGTGFYKFELIGEDASSLKAFKKAYRTSLDVLHLSTAQADAMVSEANQAFLMNILIFEERDVASGHIDRVHTLEEIFDMVKLSPLKFQKAYGIGDPSGKANNKCPFLPAASMNQTSGEVVPHEHVRCPWPFIWLHDPRTALVLHPMKNIGAAIGLYGFIEAVRKAPRGIALMFAALSPFLLLYKIPHGGMRRTQGETALEMAMP